jgi:hypothetical protein
LESVFGFEVDKPMRLFKSVFGFDASVLSCVDIQRLTSNRVDIHPSMPTPFCQQAKATGMKINTQLENVKCRLESTVSFKHRAYSKDAT